MEASSSSSSILAATKRYAPLSASSLIALAYHLFTLLALAERSQAISSSARPGAGSLSSNSAVLNQPTLSPQLSTISSGAQLFQSPAALAAAAAAASAAAAQAAAASAATASTLNVQSSPIMPTLVSQQQQQTVPAPINLLSQATSSVSSAIPSTVVSGRVDTAELLKQAAQQATQQHQQQYNIEQGKSLIPIQ